MDEFEEPIEKRFEDLCQDLCLDANIREESWEKYKDVWTNFSIDGDQIHWLVCSLYESCRRSISDDYGGVGGRQGNETTYVSLCRLLSTAKMSFVQFFHRIRRWVIMTSASLEMRDRIELLERQFSVSSVAFRAYIRSFSMLFNQSVATTAESGNDVENVLEADLDPDEVSPITNQSIFRFAWLLFIKSRAHFPACTDDLVNSFYLLACCLDWIVGLVLTSPQADQLISLQVSLGLPTDFVAQARAGTGDDQADPDDEGPSMPRLPCMLRPICDANDINYVEAKTAKEHFFQPLIKQLIEKGILQLQSNSGLMQPANFEASLTNLTNSYEDYIMGTGDFDERIYLSPNANEEIGSIASATNQQLDESATSTNPSGFVGGLVAQRYMFEVSKAGYASLADSTRSQLALDSAGAISRLNGGVSFINQESRGQTLSQLKALLAGRSGQPNQALVDLVEAHCPSTSPSHLLTSIQSHLASLERDFLQTYTGLDSDQLMIDPGSQSTADESAVALLASANQRAQLGRQLFLLALENLLVDEVKKLDRRRSSRLRQQRSTTIGGDLLPGLVDLTSLLEQHMFHQSLYACCMEVVLLACDSPDKQFPWVLSALALDAFYFFKVIETLVRNVEFPRDVVKYLNQVAELIIDSYIWRSNSAFWHLVKASGGRIPSVEEVIPPDRLDLAHVRQLHGAASALLTSSATGGGDHGDDPIVVKTSSTVISPIKQSRVSHHHLTEDESAEAAAQLLMADLHEGGDQDEENPSSAWPKRLSAASLQQRLASSNPPPRHDSLAIVARHLYQTASLRLRDLCDRLGLLTAPGGDPSQPLPPSIMSRSWTLVEHVVVNEAESLLKDRNFDQLLLCSLYAITKASLALSYHPSHVRSVSFADILQAYRMQPQSHRDIYRRVLISSHSYIAPIAGPNVSGSSSDGDLQGGQTVKTEDRADLTRFYNLVFLPQLKSIIKATAASESQQQPAVNMSPTSSSAGGGMAPMPTLRSSLLAGSPTTSTSVSSSTGYDFVVASMSSSGGSGDRLLHSSTSVAMAGADVSHSRRLASNRNIFISPVKRHHQQSQSGGLSVSSRGSSMMGSSLLLSSSSNNAVGNQPATSTSSLTGVSPRKLVYTVGQSNCKDLTELNLAISSADRRSSSSVGGTFKRPALINSPHTGRHHGPLTIVGGGGAGPAFKRIDFEMQ